MRGMWYLADLLLDHACLWPNKVPGPVNGMAKCRPNCLSTGVDVGGADHLSSSVTDARLSLRNCHTVSTRLNAANWTKGLTFRQQRAGRGAE